MSPPSYPPYDFTCPYTDNCPYLDGLSTTWVLGEYRRADDTYHEHLRIIDAFDEDIKAANERIHTLERENAELKAKLIALHQRQFKSNKKADKSMQPSLQRGKKRGAPVGHPGWVRPKQQHIDRTVHVPAPTVCPYCQYDKLRRIEETKEHMQEDIVLKPRTVVTRYLHEQAFCARCNRPVVQPGEGELLNSPIGPVAKSAAVYLRYSMGLSYRKLSVLFRDMFGLDFVPASAVGFDRKAAALGGPIYEDLRQKIRVSEVLYADETSWRNNGVGHFIWFAGNEKLAFFHIDRHRSADVAKSIFGPDFQGILVRDRYAAYNGIGKDWQSCLCHISTRAKEITQEHEHLPEAEKDKAVKSFCDNVVTFCKEVCIIGKQLRMGSIDYNGADDIEKHLIKNLVKICKRPLRFKPAESLRTYLLGPEQKHLFTFLRHPGVQPTNNHAEQSQRALVIFRKICFGTRSESGLETHSILPSLLQTARRQNVHPREFLQTLLTSDTATAQAALYYNSS